MVPEPEEWLPPVQLWRGTSERLVAGTDAPWAVPAELTEFMETPSYEITLEWLERLCAASEGLLSIRCFGRSSQGRLLYLVVAALGEHSPEALRSSGRPTLLVQAGIHPGEIEGKDAGMMLLRDLVTTEVRALLDRANLLFIPVLNPDGHERSSRWSRPNQRGPRHMGWRTTAQNLNLNRDYVKAAAPEMRALLRLLDTWPVELYLDIHSTDGLDFQYDVTYAYHGREGSPSWSPQISRWLDRSLNPALGDALREQGHSPLNFYVIPVDKRDLALGLRDGQMSPRFSLGYGDLRHIPTVLVETHSLKPYRQRVLATRVLLETALRHLGAETAQIMTSISADRANRRDSVPLSWVAGGSQREIDFMGVDFESYESLASGGQEIRWLGSPRVFSRLPVYTDRIGLSAYRPSAYLVPVWKTEVLEILRLHGVEFETLDEAETLDVTMYRVVCSETPTPPHPEEGCFPVAIDEVRRERRRETFPAGSARILTDQPLGDLAIMMLEPQGADSLYRWGFFNEILHRTEYIEGYVIAPLAERMLASDSKLRAEFAAKIAKESDFASDSAARLQWFYARTPFFDDHFQLYPIGIV